MSQSTPSFSTTISTPMTTIQQPTLAPPSQTTTTTIYNNPSTFDPPLKTSHLNGGDGLHDFDNYNQSQNETNQLHRGQGNESQCNFDQNRLILMKDRLELDHNRRSYEFQRYKDQIMDEIKLKQQLFLNEQEVKEKELKQREEQIEKDFLELKKLQERLEYDRIQLQSQIILRDLSSTNEIFSLSDHIKVQSKQNEMRLKWKDDNITSPPQQQLLIKPNTPQQKHYPDIFPPRDHQRPVPLIPSPEDAGKYLGNHNGSTEGVPEDQENGILFNDDNNNNNNIATTNNLNNLIINHSVGDSIIHSKQQHHQQIITPINPPPKAIILPTLIQLSITDTANRVVNEADMRMESAIDKYTALSKQLKASAKKLHKVQKEINRRQRISKKRHRVLRGVQRNLYHYIEFLKRRHHHILHLFHSLKDKETKIVTLDNDLQSLSKITTEHEIEIETQTQTILDLNKKLTKSEKELTEFQLSHPLAPAPGLSPFKSIPIYELHMILNRHAWRSYEEQTRTDNFHVVQRYEEQRALLLGSGLDPSTLGPPPIPLTAHETGLKINVMWIVTNLKKYMHTASSYNSNAPGPLFHSLYIQPGTTLRPLFGYFFQRDFDDGTIPQLSDQLKLYFSSPHVENGRWVQFHGPGKEIDGDNHSICTLAALCDPNRKGRYASLTHRDRCDLSKADCKAQHKPSDQGYQAYHSSPTTTYTSPHQVSIKWE